MGPTGFYAAPLIAMSDAGREDFDLIAALPARAWDHNSHYHRFLLRQLPPVLDAALDVGCGTWALMVLDLYRACTALRIAAAATAMPASPAMRLLRTGAHRSDRKARELWRSHGAHDHYPTLAEVSCACAELLPDARIRFHLYWRYSRLWRRGSTT